MNGLNLELFLRLLRADLGAWLSLCVILVLLALMLWTSWGSRRAPRKCLALSVVMHLALVVSGSQVSLGLLAPGTSPGEVYQEHIRQIRVSPVASGSGDPKNESHVASTGKGRRLADWDRPGSLVAAAT